MVELTGRESEFYYDDKMLASGSKDILEDIEDMRKSKLQFTYYFQIILFLLLFFGNYNLKYIFFFKVYQLIQKHSQGQNSILGQFNAIKKSKLTEK